MIPDSSHPTWSLDQLTKSEFFHQKLHEWKMLSVAEAVEAFRGENLKWGLPDLGISQSAWNKVIHRGIKPVTVFAHPEVLVKIPGSTGYYRMLSMVSQKSMARVGLGVNAYETGTLVPDQPVAEQIARHLNQIISRLIEFDEEVSAREFDLWRGMAAGTQAQGSWQNAKGEQVEVLVKGLVQRRLRERGRVAKESVDGGQMELSDGRVVTFGDEPDIAFRKGGQIRAAVEVKGGIDPAGVLERVGAALKSLNRVREENPTAVTILVIQGASLTDRARGDLSLNRHIITHWFTVERLLTEEAARAEVFELLDI
ncbi:MAG: XcyI family restriction endonuclease [Candidatus Micrarchaeaceae archaeon]